MSKKNNNKTFLKQRRLARLAENPRERSRHDCPNQTEFGQPEYVDEQGRGYRVAHLREHEWMPGEPVPPRSLNDNVDDRLDARGSLKLWMRRAKGKPGDMLMPGESLHLRPNRPGLREQWVTVDATEQTRAVQRTSNIFVLGFRGESQ